MSRAFYLAPLLLLGTSALLLSGCGSASSQASPQRGAPKVIVAKPLIEELVEWDPYTGRLDAIDSVDIQARVSGYLQSIHFSDGDTVKKGDLLFVIDPRPFEAEVDQAVAKQAEAEAQETQAEAMLVQAESEKKQSDARYTLAEQQLKRTKDLFAKGVATQDDIDIQESEFIESKANVSAAEAKIESAKAGIATAKAAIATAKANVESAKLNLSYTKITAPFSGLASRHYVSEGNLISGGSAGSTVLTNIIKLDPIHCYFDANEQALLKYIRLIENSERKSSRDTKNPVYMALNDEKGFPHKGHMDFVENQVDKETGSIRARAIFPNEDETLVPGLFTRVRIPGSAKHKVILVPDSAIGSDLADKFVFVVNGESTIERKMVEIGPILFGLRVIRTGLEGDETVVIRGVKRVRPGVKVEAEEEPVELGEGEGLPNEYEPVPEDEWLSRSPAPTSESLENEKGVGTPAGRGATADTSVQGGTSSEEAANSSKSADDVKSTDEVKE